MNPEPFVDDLARSHRVRPTDKLRGECWVIATKAGVEDRQSRLGLAEFLLGRDIESWNDLSRFEWMRLCDAYRGWLFVREMRHQAGKEP